ncbi:MAG: rod-binding protein, partial [Gammaproteobacteria bacterium]|nr:rod-binding protein [Gammaproteobacteria bacterium]
MAAFDPPTSSISMASQNANTYSDLNGLASLKNNPKSPQAIHGVAEQIDALFLQMMLKSMRQASAEVGEHQSNELGMYQDLFDKQIALSISARGGLGIGAMIARQLEAQAGGGAPAAAIAEAGPAPPAGAGAKAGAYPLPAIATAGRGYAP